MVDIRQFFNGKGASVCFEEQIANCTNSQKKAPASTNRPKATRHEPIPVDEEEEQPLKVQKTSAEAKSKYFGKAAENSAQVEKVPEPKTSKTAVSPKKRARPTSYVNLDSDLEDSEEEFKPGKEEEEDDFDDDFDEKEEPEEDEKEDIDEDLGLEEDVSIQEIEPPKARKATPPASPKKKRIKLAKPAQPTGESTGVTADVVLSQIDDAELPEAPETGGKMNYFALKSKQQSVLQPTGLAELPEAAPNCLGGLTIVFTGVLPNLDRDAAESLAKRYGAKVTKSILKKTSLVVIGEEAGPSKVKKIKDFGIKAISEDGFLELLRRMPADGGDGANAQAAKKKREEEEQSILDQAMEEERKERQAELARRVKAESGQQTTSEPAKPREIPNSEKLWTVKYAPADTNQLCGNKGQVAKLRNWLSHWFENSKRDFKAGGSDGSGVFRAALISGPPGIGKTTAAHLVAHELGFDVLEKNASDVRSKSLLNSNLKAVLSNTSVVGYFKNHAKKEGEHTENERKFCIIMDEVDGMSSGDHGGAGALSAFCRVTNMPMILICNDKSLPKMRTFDKVTLQLPFKRPSEMEMRSRLLTIAHREKLKLDPTVIGQLVQATGNDIRQIINLMSTVSRTQKAIGHENARGIANSWKKHTQLKPFAIASQMLGGSIFNENLGSTLNDQIEMYFNDIDFTPLMIQENYLLPKPHAALSPLDHLRRVADAADDISRGDHVNSMIRSSEQQWSLLPFHAVMSSVRPARTVNGIIRAQINFSSWLGNNSRMMKHQRMLQELQYHTRMRTSTSKTELRLDYVPVMREHLTAPLAGNNGADGIESVIDTMDYYYMTRDDWDSVLELGVGAYKAANVTKPIVTKVKTAFTRKYNSSQHPVAIYKTGNSVGGQVRKQNVDFEDVVEDDTAKDEEEVEGESEGIDAKKDKLIKEVKPKAKPKAKAKAKPRAKAKA